MSDHLTSDRNDPRLTHGIDTEKVSQAEAYLILSSEERAKGYIRPVRYAYIHKECGTLTSMGTALSETYARDPKFYGATYCVYCSKHLPVSDFYWDADGETVGS